MKKMMMASLMAMAVGGASAQAYVGGSFGVTNLDASCTGATDCKNNDTGYKLYGGYKFTPNIAVEVGYANFGKASATVYDYYYGNLHPEYKSTAPFLVGVGRGNFTSSLAGVARLGVANVETTLDTTQVSTGIVASQSKTEVQALFGLALEYAFTKNFKASVDADFTKTSEILGQSASIRMLSIGAQYNF